ncbi:hypothetical protein KQX54_001130 [Cotesia glomerata]|uniref:Uncharacterized protein n=1 Tax=Cotesia glomerata TaxID=32391 RepID=A0AAV7IWC4_COTGL|nr:hypothetical protein KQX54_001130 [Cotesia glomerata]
MRIVTTHIGVLCALGDNLSPREPRELPPLGGSSASYTSSSIQGIQRNAKGLTRLFGYPIPYQYPGPNLEVAAPDNRTSRVPDQHHSQPE